MAESYLMLLKPYLREPFAEIAQLRQKVAVYEAEQVCVELLRAAIARFLEDFRAGTHNQWQASLQKLREAVRE
jgi:hypothetical protein